ncbi:MAG: hypothetical protein WCJ33_02300 [Pseudomonadota bacterium]
MSKIKNIEAITKFAKCGVAAPFSLREKARMRVINYKNQFIDFLQNPSPLPSPKGRGSFAIASTLKRFSHSEQGSVLILVAASVLMLVAATGATIDMARAQTLQGKIASALDAAGLAAGATANSVDIQSQATRYFNANFPTGSLGAGTVAITTTCGDLNGNTVTCGSTSTYTINLTASTTQSTTFMKAVGISSIPVTAKSQITRATSGIELALVIDNTGSMGSSVLGGNVNSSNPSKIDAVKCAIAGNAAFGTGSTTCTNEGLVTTGLLDILYGPNQTLTDLFVGVVPFSDMVNINATIAPGLNFVNNITAGNKASMGGCVDSRSYTTLTTTGSGISLPTGESLTLDISDDPPSASASNTYFTALTSNNNSDCPSAILPMTVNKSDVIGAIKNMGANGNTEIQLGFAWGWRMLSPNWTGLWGNSPTYTYPNTTTTVKLPLPYQTAKMQKVMVLMTDGQNTVPGTHSQNNAYQTQSTYPNTVAKFDTLTKSACDAIKSKGISIYTIGFGPTSGVNYTLLQYCSSTPTVACGNAGSYCFKALTNADLASAFQQIGDVLANLRVSQ